MNVDFFIVFLAAFCPDVLC